jgi:hypothetical protein
MGRGNCMNANFERYLIEFCASKVCPAEGATIAVKRNVQNNKMLWAGAAAALVGAWVLFGRK